MYTIAMKDVVTIYTDGASRGNPGPGGWAAIIMAGTKVIELAGAQNPATNNQMELMAAQEALLYAKKQFPKKTIVLHADSAYVLNGLESWIYGWRKNGWMTAAKKPVENRAQWEVLSEIKDFFGARLELIKVAGHSGHVYNDRCDELAVAAALGEPYELFSGTAISYEKKLATEKPKSVQKKVPTKTTTKKSDAKAYSYVSCVDGVVHADKTWGACERRVKGKKGAKYKKVFSKEEETNLVQEYTLDSLFF